MSLYNDECKIGVVRMPKPQDGYEWAVRLTDKRMNSQVFLFACKSKQAAIKVCDEYIKFINQIAEVESVTINGE